MSEDKQEYVVFSVENKEGQQVEMAVVDEFDYEDRHYVVSAVVNNDEINEDELYIYRAMQITEDGFVPEKITDMKEYNKVSEAYMAIED